MGTSWAEVITNSAMVYIDDLRLREDLAVNPAQFFRKMALYMNQAIPLLNRPPELLNFLTVGLICLLYTSPSPRDRTRSRMPSSA